MNPDFYLRTPDNQELAIYTQGDKTKTPVLLIHGGPGGAVIDKMFAFFDLTKYYVIGFDQRGCGKSTPFATLVNNTIDKSAEDIEQLRKYFGYDKWIIFGGSYGTTLGLYYAIKNPSHILTLVLRGVFLGRAEDVAWLYQDGASFYYPEAFREFRDFISPSDQKDLIQAYYKIFTGKDEEKKKEACKRWSTWENSIVHLYPQIIVPDIRDSDISLATFECHYFANHMFWKDDNFILNNTDIIKDIPTFIVHGRYDIDCRPSGAYQLAQKLNDVELTFTNAAGHSPYEKTTFEKLKAIFEKLSH